jgi:hypothetical protein
MASPQLALALQALAQSYEYVVIDAGAMPQNGAERIAQFAPRAALIADSVDASQTVACRDRLVAAGFTTVSVLVAAPSEPLASGKSTRSAA